MTPTPPQAAPCELMVTVQIAGRSKAACEAIVQGLKHGLSMIDGQPRPLVKYALAVSELVEQAPGPGEKEGPL